MKDILKLYLIADYLYFDEGFLYRIEKAIKGGVTAVQFRFKGIDDRQAFETAKDISTLCKRMGTPFFVNNRTDFALLLDADGVHVGQDDLPVKEVRRLLSGKLVGVSAGDYEEFLKIRDTGADYVSFGSVFSTPTKQDAGAPIELQGLRALVNMAMEIPKIAIGGITLKNVENVMSCGVDGVAVAGAIMKAEDPESVVREFRRIIG